MTREFAIAYLMDLGWNKYGAEAIVDQLIEDQIFDGLTTPELKDISDDYMDR